MRSRILGCMAIMALAVLSAGCLKVFGARGSDEAYTHYSGAPLRVPVALAGKVLFDPYYAPTAQQMMGRKPKPIDDKPPGLGRLIAHADS